MSSVRGVRGFELARMRNNADDHATSIAHVYRPARTSDSRGGATVVETRVGHFRIRKAPFSTIQSPESVYAEKLGGNQGWWLTFPASADVRMDDRIESSGRNYQVVGYDLDRGEAVSSRVLCRELT